MKQVQYFDHQHSKSLEQFYFKKHFPAYLPAGHLTGEASPGYLVYAAVPARIHAALPEVRLIAVVRDPLRRLWSSYFYSYGDLVAGVVKQNHGTPNPAVAARAQHFVEVEVELLARCFAEKGYDPRRGTSAAAAPLVDVTADCFATGKSGEAAHLDLVRAAHRRWATAGADRSRLGADDAGGGDDEGSEPSAADRAGAGRVVFPRANPHLFRQLVARGCYSAMLEHYYAAFRRDQVRVLCTEHLAPDPDEATAAAGEAGSNEAAARVGGGSTATAAATMRGLARWLGLAGATVHDFEATVGQGRFNAAGKRGYDQLSAWGSSAGDAANGPAARAPGSPEPGARPPMPASLRRTLASFYAPLNGRLFELAGARCPWPGLED